MTSLSASVRRWTGFRFFERRGRKWELRFSWAEITSNVGFGGGLCHFDDDPRYTLHLHLGWPNMFIRVPCVRARGESSEGIMRKWGFSWVDGDLLINWGDWSRVFRPPWAPTWVRTSYLRRDGTWAHETRATRAADKAAGIRWHHRREERERERWTAAHPYRYTLRSGEVQEVMATIGVEESEYRPRWLVWLPWAGRTMRSIDVSFSGEIGERAGSWKGGCIGCSYELLPGESPLACLRRMERERRF